ncbi:MAG: hypothetical protein P8Y23_13485 [Candidatus Lokiarchaeota archaeon]
MQFNPEEIYKTFLDKKIDKVTLIDQLVSMIEISTDVQKRIASIHILSDLEITNQKIFKLIENLAISDSNEYVRLTALKYLKINFKEGALEPMKWAYKHEKSFRCLLVIVKSLGNINNQPSRDYLVSILERISDQRYKKNIIQILESGNIVNYQKIWSY